MQRSGTGAPPADQSNAVPSMDLTAAGSHTDDGGSASLAAPVISDGGNASARSLPDETAATTVTLVAPTGMSGDGQGSGNPQPPADTPALSPTTPPRLGNTARSHSQRTAVVSAAPSRPSGGGHRSSRTGSERSQSEETSASTELAAAAAAAGATLRGRGKESARSHLHETQGRPSPKSSAPPHHTLVRSASQEQSPRVDSTASSGTVTPTLRASPRTHESAALTFIPSLNSRALISPRPPSVDSAVVSASSAALSDRSNSSSNTASGSGSTLGSRLGDRPRSARPHKDKKEKKEKKQKKEKTPRSQTSSASTPALEDSPEVPRHAPPTQEL